VVLARLRATHLVTYIVVGSHVQLVYCTPVLLHLRVLPAQRSTASLSGHQVTYICICRVACTARIQLCGTFRLRVLPAQRSTSSLSGHLVTYICICRVACTARVQHCGTFPPSGSFCTEKYSMNVDVVYVRSCCIFCKCRLYSS
jgi:hypothetical protein